MAGISLRSNIAALRAQRRLGEASDLSARSFERLSSGLRINRASDDAAGIAIASSLNASRKVFIRGVQNLNDGLSLTNVADGAISQLSSVVIRIRELATQAANGTLLFRQRRSLDTEAQALADEFYRITRASEFNGLKLFDGTIQDLRIQGGYGVDGSVVSNLGGALGNGTFGELTSYTQESNESQEVALGDLNGDGILDMVTAGTTDAGIGETTIRLGNGDGTFRNGISYSSEGMVSNAVSLADLNGDGVLDLVTAGFSPPSYDPTYADGHATVRLGNGDGTFGSVTQYLMDTNQVWDVTLGDLNNDGILDMATVGNEKPNPSVGNSITVRLGLGDGTFGTAITVASGINSSLNDQITLGDLNRDGMLDLVTSTDSGFGTAQIRLGNGDGTFGAVTNYTQDTSDSDSVALGDLNGDGILDLVTGGNNGLRSSATVRLGNGDGTFGAATSYLLESITSASRDIELADLNGDGLLDLLTSSGLTTRVRFGNGDGSFGNATSYTNNGHIINGYSLGDINGDGVLDLVTASMNNSGTDGFANVRLGTAIYGINPLLEFDLTTKAGAMQSLGMLDRKLDQLNSQRGVIGALQSRLTSAVRTLESRADNYAAAESRIKDADIASDSAQLVRSSILSQAASAVLAQANQLPAIALSLLQG